MEIHDTYCKTDHPLNSQSARRFAGMRRLPHAGFTIQPDHLETLNLDNARQRGIYASSKLRRIRVQQIPESPRDIHAQVPRIASMAADLGRFRDRIKWILEIER